MLPLLWLAFIAPPIVIDHAPVPLPQPVLAQRVLAVPRCGLTRCLDGEWQVDAMAAIPAGQRRIDGNDLPGADSLLWFEAAQRRDWLRALGSNASVGMRYGMRAMQAGDASLVVELGPGFRLQPYADDGIGGTGPVLNGRIEWQRPLGERARVSQVTRLETGEYGTFLRNSLLLKLQLQEDLTLSSGVEVRRDSDARNRNRTDATLNLRYAF